MLPYSPTWEKVYFEKGDQGSVRSGTRRHPFRAKVDEARGAVRLFDLDGDAERTLEATFSVHDGALHLEGVRAGRPFAVDLTREFPK